MSHNGGRRISYWFVQQSRCLDDSYPAKRAMRQGLRKNSGGCLTAGIAGALESRPSVPQTGRQLQTNDRRVRFASHSVPARHLRDYQTPRDALSRRMPERQTLERARQAKRQGKAASTQAGEFVREEIRHIRRGKHGARSTKQAIAIGLSKARRAGVGLRPPEKGTVSEKTRKSATSAYAAGQSRRLQRSRWRSKAIQGVLKREGRSSASRKALSRQARSAAQKRNRNSRSARPLTRARRNRSSAAKNAGRAGGRRH